MRLMSEPDVQASETEPSAAVSDARLVEEARLGDQQAFGDLVNRYERRLISVILRFVSEGSVRTILRSGIPGARCVAPGIFLAEGCERTAES